MDRTQKRKKNSILLSLALWACLWITGCQPNASLHDPWATDSTTQKAHSVIKAALTDKNPRIRTSGIEAVASSRILNYTEQVHTLARDSVVPVRFAALVAMGDLQYRPAQSACQQIFQESQEDANVRLAAAYALVQMGQSAALPALRQGLTSMDPSLRSNAAFLLGKAGDRESIDTLHHILVTPDLDEQTTRQIIDTLAQLRDNRIYQTLWSRLISLYADDRIQGIRGMGQLGHNQAQKAIQTLLNDEIPEVRLAAAEELARLGDKSGEGITLNILKTELNTRIPTHQANDADRIRLHAMAARTIGALQTEATKRYLPKLLQDPSTTVRIAAAQAVLCNQFQWQR